MNYWRVSVAVGDTVFIPAGRVRPLRGVPDISRAPWAAADSRIYKYGAVRNGRASSVGSRGQLYLQTSRSRSLPNSSRRNLLVSTRDPVVGPHGLKRPSENRESPPYEAPSQNFQFLTGHSGVPGLCSCNPLRGAAAHGPVHSHAFGGPGGSRAGGLPKSAGVIAEHWKASGRSR